MQLNPPSDQHLSLPTATFDRQCLTLSILSLLVLTDPASLDQRGHVSPFCGTFFSRPSRRVTLFILQSIQRGPVCSQWARTCITENRTHLHLYCLKAGWIGIRPSSMSTRLFFYSQDRRHSLFLLFFLYFLLRLGSGLVLTYGCGVWLCMTSATLAFIFSCTFRDLTHS